MSDVLFKDESYQIVGAAMDVWGALGFGFLESVYEHALLIELRERGLRAENQVPVNVFYKDQTIGKFFVDVLVNDEIILELKTAEQVSQNHMGQALNYLKATNHRLAIILNFGPNRLEFKRMVV